MVRQAAPYWAKKDYIMKKIIRQEHPFKRYFEVVNEASESISLSTPYLLRPIAKIISYILFAILLPIILLPTVPFVLIFRKKKPDSLTLLFDDLKIIWHKKSSKDALIDLRKIKSQLSTHFDKLKKMKSIQINPYGKFRWFEYAKVVETLYLWELQHNNLENANEICDNFLTKLLPIETKLDRGTERWIVNKAKVINKLEGYIAAQNYLLEYLDPKKKNSPIKEYLYELRKEQ